MKQPNLYPSDPTERAWAERVVDARMVGLLRKDYRERHGKGVCDAMEGFCAQLTSAFFFVTGGQKGPYALFRIAKGDLGGEDTHYFLVDTRKLPRGWQKVGSTKAFVALGAPTSAVVDLTASQFTVPIPYRLGRRVALSQRKGGDVAPTQKTAQVLERAGLLKRGRAGGNAKSEADLKAFLDEVVPVLVYDEMIRTGAVKVCGSISDTFASLAASRGFEAYVIPLYGHFVNEVVTTNGVFRVDLSAIQFDCMDEDDVLPALRKVTEDPFAAITVTRVPQLDDRARPARPEEEVPPGRESWRDLAYRPVARYPKKKARYERAARGEYDPQFDAREVAITEGKPFGWGRRSR